MASELERRGGIATSEPGVGTGTMMGPGRSSLTAGALPRTTADLAGGMATGMASQLGPVRVTADRLNVRLEPRVADENVVGGLARGATVMPLRRNGEWIQINYRGQQAYIHSGFVEHTQAAPAQPQVAAAATPTAAPTTATATPTAAMPTATTPTTTTPAATTPTATTPTAATPTATTPAHAPTVAHVPTPAPTMTTATAATETPPPGSSTPNTADHTPAATPYAGAMDARGGKALTDTSYMASYHHLVGGGSLADAPTTPAEGEVLNKIRLDTRKIDPASMRALQQRLGIQNASGAMNTETLRKLKQEHPTFTVESLLSGQLLGADLAIALGGTGFGADRNGHALRDNTATAEGERKADAMARVAGFADYATMHRSFVRLELFGQPLGMGLPFLADRLRLADAYLRQRVPEAAGINDRDRLRELAQQKLQWDGKGNGAYADNADDIGKPSGGRTGAHFHANGLAIDLNPSNNPFVFATGSMKTTIDGKTGDSMDGIIANHLRYAAQIFGGEEITPKTMMKWSKELSSEELAAKIDMASHSLTLYLELCESATDEILETRFVNVGYPANKAKELAKSARKFGHSAPHVRRVWQDNLGRSNATGLTTHSMDIIVALRDVAGLSWGGTEMSEGASGDFMHFDCRGTSLGQKLFAFAMNNRGAERVATPAHGPDNHHAAATPDHP